MFDRENPKRDEPLHSTVPALPHERRWEAGFSQSKPAEPTWGGNSSGTSMFMLREAI